MQQDNKQIESIKFFKKQMESLRKKSNNTKMMREQQDKKMEKLLQNYQTHQIVYTLSQCTDKYNKALDKQYEPKGSPHASLIIN
jgi:hypothetical protein